MMQLAAGEFRKAPSYQFGFQILINDAASDAQSEYWKYVDDLTSAETVTSDNQGHSQDDLHNFFQLGYN